MRNIVLLHERVKFWLDITRSPRFSPKQVDNAINIAINEIVKNRFEPSITNGKQQGTIELKGFQRNKTIREELKPLVKHFHPNSFTNNIILNSDSTFITISDYGYYTLFEIKLTGKTGTNAENKSITVYPIEVIQEKFDMISKDPYERPTIVDPTRTYFTEDSLGYTFFLGDMGNYEVLPTNVKVSYLAIPLTVFYGFETTVGAVTNGTNFIVSQEAGTVYSVMQKIGTEITSMGAAGTTKVVYGYQSSDIPDVLFDEIAKIAANILLATIGKSAPQQQQ